MTLQQKLLAKKSKKGFTLVELVVVIAILAILAAIAIPMVVNIINSATASSGASQASTISQNARSLYASVKSGAVNNNDSFNADGTQVTFAADKGANASTKRDAANDMTIQEVMTYAGLNIDLSGNNYFFCTATQTGNGVAVGDVTFVENATAPDGNPEGTTWAQLEVDTTMQELYPEGANP